MTRLVAVVLVALAGLLAADAQASVTPRQANRLVQVASDAAGKPIRIVIEPGSYGGNALVGGDTILLAEQTYRDAAAGKAIGLFFMLHEVGHATGIEGFGPGEGKADCFALHHFQRALGFFHLSRTVARWRWLDALAINRQHLEPFYAPYGCGR